MAYLTSLVVYLSGDASEHGDSDPVETGVEHEDLEVRDVWHFTCPKLYNTIGCVELLKVAKCTTDFNPCNFSFSLPFWKEENAISVKTTRCW